MTVVPMPRRTDVRPFAAASAAFVDAHITGAWSPGTAVKYRQTLAGIDRAGHAIDWAAASDLAALNTPAGSAELAAAYTAAYGTLAPATQARHLAALRSAIAWWRQIEWLITDPTLGWARPRVEVDTTRSLTRSQIDALFALDVGLREKTLWRMLYETAARANEMLSLDVDDLDLANNRAAVRGKGGTIRWVIWQTGSARLLPRLLTGRRTGPVFLSARPPRIPVAVGDRDPVTSRARLSYRRAAELFEDHTRVLVARRRDDEPVRGWTLHQLRHSALTHDAEQGTSDPMLLARSGHASVRSLERYARPGPDALAAHLARTDPAARRQDRS